MQILSDYTSTASQVRRASIQWTPSDQATLGTSQSVLIRGVVSLLGFIDILFSSPSDHHFLQFQPTAEDCE